jgi:hypothetical protein
LIVLIAPDQQAGVVRGARRAPGCGRRIWRRDNLHGEHHGGRRRVPFLPVMVGDPP